MKINNGAVKNERNGNDILRNPDISPKKEQTYEEAMAALQRSPEIIINDEKGLNIDRTVYLTDISSKLYTTEMIVTALKNHRCFAFKDIPSKFYTDEVLIAAFDNCETFGANGILEKLTPDCMSKDVFLMALKTGEEGVVKVSPDEYFDSFEMAQYAASSVPAAVDLILSKFRRNRLNSPYTEQDKQIVFAAMCPMEYAKNRLNDIRKTLSNKGVMIGEMPVEEFYIQKYILRGRSLEEFAVREYGCLTKSNLFIVWQELNTGSSRG